MNHRISIVNMGKARGEPFNATDLPDFGSRWAHHLRWQRKQLRAADVKGELPRFLVLRPGDKLTECNRGGEQDVRSTCFKARSPRGRQRPAHMHWDSFLLGSNHEGKWRPIPGLGNIALSLVSAAATAMASRRVLLLENMSTVGESFGPMRELLVETSGWAPRLAAAALQGGETDSFMAHDDYAGFADLCRLNLRRSPEERVWRIFSNQYFLPLLLLNPFHGANVEAMAAPPSTPGRSPSLWTPAIRALWQPRPELLSTLTRFMEGSRLSAAPFVSMHMRMKLSTQRTARFAQTVCTLHPAPVHTLHPFTRTRLHSLTHSYTLTPFRPLHTLTTLHSSAFSLHPSLIFHPAPRTLRPAPCTLQVSCARARLAANNAVTRPGCI